MGITEENKAVKKAMGYIIGKIIISIFVLLVVFFGVWFGMERLGLTGNNAITDFFIGKEGQVSTISEVSIKKIFEVSELSTADYVYNAVARVYEDDGTSIRYYVAYEGTVKAGIDFNEIDIEVKEDEKCIVIMLPEIDFQQKTVNPGTLEYIFVDKKSETENVHQEAYELCQKDLDEKVEQDEELWSSVEKNTKIAVEALFEPWMKQIQPDYKVEVTLKRENYE